MLIASVMLLSCQGALSPLATQEPFLTSPAATAGAIGLETADTITRQQALLAIQRACGAAGTPNGLREDPGIVCHDRSTGFYGRTAEVYRRWVEDDVRELPDPSQTAASIGD